MANGRERDIIRSEGEGFGLQQMDPEHFLSIFLGRVKRKFTEDSNTKHIEDVLPEVIDMLTDLEKNVFLSLKDMGIELEKDLSTHFKSFLGDEDWDKFETLERDRILDHDIHNDQGVG
ncbi:MAG TPA: hypothetical protein VKC54_02300 [Patescibacteria group bacterium]|nr:hypothetical protein [Patescibacteria group bacterium]